MSKPNDGAGILSSDDLDYLAEQVSDLVCALDPEQLTAVFERIRRIVAQDQASIEGHATEQNNRLARLLED